MSLHALLTNATVGCKDLEHQVFRMAATTRWILVFIERCLHGVWEMHSEEDLLTIETPGPDRDARNSTSVAICLLVHTVGPLDGFTWVRRF